MKGNADMRNIVRIGRLLALISIVMLVVVLPGCAGNDDGVRVVTREPRIRVSTTTSLYDTGLWNALEDEFEGRNDMRLDIVYAGTGIALEYGKRGDVDALAVHDKAREEAFIAEGYGVERVPFAYNYFVIAGPPDDPAALAGLGPEDAFRKLYEEQSASFVSRGDDSGTHSKEKAIWKAAGLDYEEVRTSGSWYIDRGGGMGPSLLMASEKQAYLLSDVGTFLAFQGDTGLEPIVEKGSIMLNVYSAIAVDPDVSSVERYERAQGLIDFLVSAEIQEYVGEYGVRDFGRPLFIPCAGNEPIA
jgi:tungstate transport system substrate-binding protein